MAMARHVREDPEQMLDEFERMVKETLAEVQAGREQMHQQCDGKHKPKCSEDE